MREFRVTLNNRAGELARLTQVLAEHGINLKSVAGVADGHRALVCLVAEDVEAMRATLTSNRIVFAEEEVVTALLENESGQVAELAAKLGTAGINIHSFYILARDEPLIEIGMTVDEPKKAKKLLGG